MADEAVPPAPTRKVIADKRLDAANQIMRMLGDFTTSERTAIMQIVNLLVQTPTQTED